MLELVATMPSKPFGAGALVRLDIFSRLIGLITVAEPRQGCAGHATFCYTPN
jgi:hypothetical protein